MVARARKWLVAAVLGMAETLLPSAKPAAAQEPVLPPVPIPVTPRAADAPATPILGRPVPVQYAPPTPAAPTPLPAAPSPTPPPARNDPLFAPVDPGPNGWGPLGPSSLDLPLFFNIEVQIVRPSVNNRLVGTVPLPDGTTDTVMVPGTSFHWTASPRFEFGVHLPDSEGDFSFAYRFLVSDGNGTIPGVDTTQSLHSRLDLNVIDLDYTSSRYSPWPRWDFRWRLGARLAALYFDARSGISLPDVGEISSQRSSNYFFGGGPVAGVDLERQIGLFPDLSLFGRLDTAYTYGQLRQRFAEHTLDQNGNPFDTSSTMAHMQSLPVLNVQAGFIYKADRLLENLRFSGGYTFERWWNAGKLGDSRGELTIQGLFLRGEWDF
jgi:hypothetical protein